MIRSKFLPIFCILFSLSASFLQAQVLTIAPGGGKNAVEDPRYERGLALSPLSPNIVNAGGGYAKTNTDTLRFDGDPTVAPFWQVAQWYSKYDLAHTPLEQTQYGLSHRNEGKQIALADDGTLTLEILTSHEYDAPRENGQNWPHLLIQHDFVPHIAVAGLSGLQLSFSYRLLYCTNQMLPGQFNSSLHTAQSPFYLMLHNSNPNSGDYGANLWFGLPSFDFRDTRLSDSPYVQWDIGTSTYIYSMPPRAIWGDILFTDHQWHHAYVDVLEMLDKAVTYLKSQGLFQNTEATDFSVTHMNFGWEVPGTFDAALQVKGFSLLSFPKDGE